MTKDLISRAAALLPCPFCGEADTIILNGPIEDDWCAVSCDRCYARGPTRYTDPHAIAAWNTRALAAIEPQPDPREDQRRILERVIRNQRKELRRLASIETTHWRFVNRVREERLADPRDVVIAQLVEVLMEMHKKTISLRGDQAYREFSRYVEKKTRAAISAAKGLKNE